MFCVPVAALEDTVESCQLVGLLTHCILYSGKFSVSYFAIAKAANYCHAQIIITLYVHKHLPCFT